jgi:hypothetical protein
MKNNTENIDRYFKTRFEQFEQAPPEKVWEKIAVQLGHDRKKGMIMLIFRIAAGMALLVSLGLGYYLISRPGQRTTPATLAINQADRTPADTLKGRPRIRNTSSKPVSDKKAIKSDRLQPVQKIYKGPEVPEENTTDDPSAGTATEAANNNAYNQSFYRAGNLAMIYHAEQQGTMPEDLPATLTRNPVAPDRVLSAEEARALLLSDNETPVEKDDAKLSRWMMGGEIAPLYSYRTIASDYLESSMIDNLNNAESGVIAYAGGIRVAYSANRRLAVQSGLYYSRYGQEKNNIESYRYSNSEVAGDMAVQNYYLDISNSTGVIQSNGSENVMASKGIPVGIGADADQAYFASLNGINYADLIPVTESEIAVEQYFDYLELPLTLKYKIIDRKFDFSLSGGLITNFLINNVVNLERNGEKTQFGNTGNISEINYLSSLGLGFEYPIISGLAFSLEPRFRYYLNPIDKSSQINVHPYSFGFFAGLSYIF